MGPVCGRLDQGRIHFQHGPIDLVIFALGESAVIEEAHAKAWARFGQILPELVAELPDLRQAIDPRVQCGMVGPVARRMWSACRPFARDFITPMAAVAGSGRAQAPAEHWDYRIERGDTLIGLKERWMRPEADCVVVSATDRVDAEDTVPKVNAELEAGAKQLADAGVAFGHGTANAFDEAAWLVLWSLKLPLDDLDSVANRPVTLAEQAQVATLLIARIESRKPAAYLTGEAWLQGIPFTVDERVIVPRSFIAELLADASIDPWLGPDTRRVLDLCTGNGSLAVLAAMAWPDVEVTGADISPDALAVARINVDQHGLQDRISLQLSDGLAQLPGPWDLILCNPPYVNAASMAQLPAEYRAEPTLALAGGADGMDFIRQLLQDAPARMSENAVLVLEIGNERSHFEAAFGQLPVYWIDTSAGEDQVLLATRQALVAFFSS